MSEPKKKLFTGYFGKHKNHPLAYVITARVPTWVSHALRCRHLKELAPSEGILHRFKYAGMTEAEYAREYMKQLESCGRTAQQIVDSLPEGAVLLCYERSGSFCHRHLAAKWLMKNANVEISEHD